MKKLMITAAALMMAVAAYGQGTFLFNTHDVSAGNNVNFTLNGSAATGSDVFVEVLAGPDLTHLTALTPTLPLSRTGAGAGYTSPFSQVYTVPGIASGSVAVAYRAYEGTSFAAGTSVSALQSTVLGGTAALSVVLAAAPAPPNEINLGAGTVAITSVPEPATLALGALGVGALLLIRRRK